MSQIRIAVIGANQLDADHELALNDLSERGHISAYALDSASLEQGRAALEKAKSLNALDAVIIAGDRADLPAWISLSMSAGWPVYSMHATPWSIEDIVEIRRTEQSHPDALLQFAFTARHHESVAAAQAKAQSGEYGALLTLRGTCGIPATTVSNSALFHPGAQMIDMMHAFADPFQDITGFADLDRSGAPGSETNVFASMRTHSGVLASLHASGTQWRPTFRLELGFEHGYLWLEGLNSKQFVFGPEVLVYAKTDGGGAQHETVDRFEVSNGTAAALETFLARVTNRALPAIGTSQDAFDTLNTIQRVLAADPIFSPIQERHVS